MWMAKIKNIVSQNYRKLVLETANNWKKAILGNDCHLGRHKTALNQRAQFDKLDTVIKTEFRYIFRLQSKYAERSQGLRISKLICKVVIK